MVPLPSHTVVGSNPVSAAMSSMIFAFLLPVDEAAFEGFDSTFPLSLSGFFALEDELGWTLMGVIGLPFRLQTFLYNSAAASASKIPYARHQSWAISLFGFC